MQDRFGNPIKVDSWIAFGTRIGNGAETRVGLVTAIHPVVVVRSLRRVVYDDNTMGWELSPISGQPRMDNIIVLEGFNLDKLTTRKVAHT
jgi:hypothetical protein